MSWPAAAIMAFALVLVPAHCRGSASVVDRVLVPRNGETIHCGGQSADAFGKYSEFMQESSPSVFMTYVGLGGLQPSYFSSLERQLANASTASGTPGYVIPQIGLALPEGKELAGVAAGRYSAEVATLVAGLKSLNRPLFVRVGYEFNGQWNNYPAHDYVTAWDTIVGAWRQDPTLNKTVAAVWDFSCDASATRLDPFLWKPRLEQPDWWGVNIFSGQSSPNGSCVEAFVDKAEATGAPVMLGESSPRGIGSQDAPWNLVQSSLNSSNCIGVRSASTVDGTILVTWSCGIGPNQLWRVTSDGFLVNDDGKCVGKDLGSPQSLAAVITECRWQGHGFTALNWTLTPDGELIGLLANGSGFCLEGSGFARGQNITLTPALLGALSCGKPSSTWEFKNSEVGGGKVAWSLWFEPYLALLARPIVMAFCYIDWFWPQRSIGFNWYRWGDARVEGTEIVGPQWRKALSKPEFLNIQKDRQHLCSMLNC